MGNEPSKHVVGAWVRLNQAQQVALSHIEEALKAANLPPAIWYDVLWQLEQAGENGLRPFELERKMLMRQYNISRLLDRIEKAGLLIRQPCAEDGRGQLVVITKAGREQRRRIWPVYADAIEGAIATHLSEGDAKTVDRLLSKLLGAPTR